MRYVIYGAGAIGAAVGARLFESGHDVVLIARGDHYSALRSKGLTYRDPSGSRVLPIPTVDHPSGVSWHSGDVAFMAMKGQATEDATRELAAVARPEIAVVCAQNGLENERVALRRFPLVYAMCVMMPASHMEPGVVEADSLPVVGVLDLGRYPSGADDIAATIAGDLCESGFRSRADADAMRWKYEKLLLNLSTAMRAVCGPESGDDETASQIRSRLSEDLRNEALACFERAGFVRPDPEEREERWGGAITRLPVEGSTALAGSAWQSLARSTGNTEADYINGEISLLGRLHYLPTPVNDLIGRLSNELARLRRPPGSIPVAEVGAMLGISSSL